MMTSLAAPLVLPCGLRLDNRVVKSAMTEALADGRRLPSQRLLRLYARWAESGAALMITGNVGVDRDHPVRPADVILDEEADLAPFREWARVAKAGGAKVIVQINHGGRQTPRFVNPRPLGPSEGRAVKTMRAFGAPRAATEEEIEDVIRRHVSAAIRLATCGFDGVQIHAAHGYLLNQFLAPDVNRRTDRWGGDVTGRSRILVEIVRRVRASVPRAFAVAVKLNSGDFLAGGFEEGDALEVVRALDGLDVDLLEISGGRYESGASFGHASPPSAREAYFLDFARRARASFRAPILLTGGLRSREAMQRVLGDAIDLVGVARPMTLVPDYPRRLLAGEPLPRVGARKLAWRSIAGPAELAWYSMQLARMAEGKDPSPTLSAWRAFAWYVASDFCAAMRARRRPVAALPAAATGSMEMRP